MNILREGVLLMRTPLPDGSNYNFKKVRMRVFMKLLGEKVG